MSRTFQRGDRHNWRAGLRWVSSHGRRDGVSIRDADRSHPKDVAAVLVRHRELDRLLDAIRPNDDRDRGQALAICEGKQSTGEVGVVLVPSEAPGLRADDLLA